MHYQPRRTLGLLVGVVLGLWSAAIAVLLLNAGITGEIGLLQLGAYVGALAAAALAVLFGYWCYALATLSYQLDRNGLVIQWGTTRQVIPLEAIERLVPGRSLDASPRVRGVSWPGCHVGRADLDRIGEVLVYSTHQSQEQVLYVMTGERTYAISVEDPARFAEEVQRRQELGPTAEVTHHVERWGVAAQALWSDRPAQALIGLALAAAVVMWAQVAIRYPDLPATLELAFPPSAGATFASVVTRDAILELPRAATALLAANLALGVLAHAWSRAAGYVLFLAAAGVQVAFFAAFAIALA
jgi:hypothetical protein